MTTPEEPVVPKQPTPVKPIASTRYLLWALVAIIALGSLIQLGQKRPGDVPAQQKHDKPPASSSDQVKNFARQQAEQAERLREEGKAAQARMEELNRTLAAYGQIQQEAAGVPPLTDAQRRAMVGPLPQQQAGGSPSPGSVSPEKTARQKAEEERVAARTAALVSTTVAVDFSDQIDKPAQVEPAADTKKGDAKQVAFVGPKLQATPNDRDEDLAEEPAELRPTARLFKILEGTILEGVLTNRLTGSFAGPINVMLTTPVYSHDHGTLLMPQGTRILGEVTGIKGQADERLFVAFHRAILPTGSSVNLDQFLGLAQQGQAGLRDQVNRHYFQIFGASVALSAIEGLGQAVGNTGANSSTLRLQSGIGQGSATGSSRIIDQMLQRLPTFTIRERTRVKIYISKDLSVTAYDPNFKLDQLL